MKGIQSSTTEEEWVLGTCKTSESLLPDDNNLSNGFRCLDWFFRPRRTRRVVIDDDPWGSVKDYMNKNPYDKCRHVI